MNREIKFRAWTRTGEWDDDGENRQFEMIDGDSLCPMEFEPFKDLLKDIDDEYYVMQFTGLHDKNGKEIYEGDIVLRIFNDENGPNEVKETVEYHDGAFYPVCEEPGIGFEVLGNIYENPELIK